MKNLVLTPDLVSLLDSSLGESRIEEIVGSRTRDWGFIVYPESAPEDWKEKLRLSYLPFAVSPLHDKDVNADGQPKKPHYHVMICADGVKSFSQLANIAKQVNGTCLINLHSARGYYRYFIHLDNPEKYQYREIDITTYNGFDPKLYDGLTSVQRYNYLEQIFKYIDKHHITDYDVLLRCCIKENYEWFKLLADRHTLVVVEYMKSIWRRKTYNPDSCPKEVSLNTETGEIEKKVASLLDYSDDNLPFE